PGGDPAEQVRLAGEVEAQLATFELDAGTAGHVRDQHPHVVADLARVDVLVQVRVDPDGAGVQPRLVRERAGADVGLAGERGDVGDLADRVRDPGDLLQPGAGESAQAELELEVGHHGEQVGVPGALPVAVHAALHVPGAGGHCGHRVRH